MKKKFNVLYNKKLTYAIVFCLFGLAVIYQHMFLPVVHDDIVRSQTEYKSVLEIIKYYWNYNGRVTTDSLALILTHHVRIWIVIDCIAYFSLVILLVEIFNRRSLVFVGISALLVLVFPFSYWESAGYISTTTNYLYSTVCFLGVILGIEKIINEKGTLTGCLISVLCITYIAFSNQFIIGTILFLFYVIVYKLWNDRKFNRKYTI